MSTHEHRAATLRDPGPGHARTALPRLHRLSTETTLTPQDASGTNAVGDLYALIGRVAEDGRAVDLSHHDVSGGWRFVSAHGGVSPAGTGWFAEDVEVRLSADGLTDMCEKLGDSGHNNRIAVLVYDHLTEAGWSTSHIDDGETPSRAISTPEEITHVLVLGMNGTDLFSTCARYTWERLDHPEASCQ